MINYEILEEVDSMKKALSIILAFILVFILASCGSTSKLPDGFDQTLYDYAEAAYELVHDYNLGKIDKEAAKQRAETIGKNVDALTVPKNTSKMSDELFKSSYELHQLTISIEMNSFSFKVASGSSTAEIEKTLKELIKK